MSERATMQRRHFLGCPLLIALGTGASPQGSGTSSKVAKNAALEIETGKLKASYDLGAGRCSLLTAAGRPLLLNATCGVMLERSWVLASDSAYARQGRVEYSRKTGIEGPQLVIECSDSTGKLDLETRITLLEDEVGAVFELTLVNSSSQDIWVRHAEPLRALLEEHSGCFFAADGHYSSAFWALTNGYQYYDPGELIFLKWIGRRSIESFWNAAFHDPESRQTLVAGYLENRQSEGRISAVLDVPSAWKDGQAAFSLTARSLYNTYFSLRAGGKVNSGRFLFMVSPDGFSGLESFASKQGRLQDYKPATPLNGWTSWAYSGWQATEDEHLANARFMAEHLKAYGLEWVQIDDGYQRAFGDWEGNEQYPHGMKWLAGQLRALGLKAGLWVAPGVIDEGTEVARDHPEWLIRDASGNPHILGSPRGKYALDITHPEARRWVYELFRRITDDWGYDFIKIDFVEWSLLAAERYYDPGIGKAGAYRLFMETVRSAIGPDRHILDCGPSPVVVGLVDSMRIELDQAHDWTQYARNSNSTAPAVARRYFFNRRTWVNDADHIQLWRLPLPQAQAAVTITALSGGNMISSDRLVSLPQEKLEILKKGFPAYGEAARPLDLWERPFPEVFALPVHTEFERWWVVGCFNWDERSSMQRDFDLNSLENLGLDSKESYHVFDFWTQQNLGTADPGRAMSLNSEPSSVRLLAIRKNTGIPQVIGTDRHFTQGAVELEGVRWESISRTLSGTALGAPAMEWTMVVHVPEGFTWDQRSRRYRDYAGFSVAAPAKGTLEVHFVFGEADRVDWSLEFVESA